jgi:hypothetical protein
VRDRLAARDERMQRWPARRPSRLSGAAMRWSAASSSVYCVTTSRSRHAVQRMQRAARGDEAVGSRDHVAVLSRASRGRQDYSVEAEPRAERTAA